MKLARCRTVGFDRIGVTTHNSAMTDEARSPAPYRNFDDEELTMPRMAFGDHLEELRNRLILALLGLLVGVILALYFAQTIQGWLCRPLFLVLKKYNQPSSLLSPAPADVFTNWFQIVFLSGLILAMPWVLYQIWQFVAAGLYRHERRWLSRFAPISVGLFVLGVAFVYLIALPIALNFFVGFNRQFTIPDTDPAAWERLLLGIHEEAKPVPVVPDATLPRVPLLDGNPADPQPGQTWINLQTKRYCVQTESGLLYLRLSAEGGAEVVQNQFAIRSYISFVLMLMLAFGLAFETPIVVVFLAWSRIITTADMVKARRYIILAIIFVAAVLTPPDVLSQALLAIPMLLLFEAGLLFARMTEQRTAVE